MGKNKSSNLMIKIDWIAFCIDDSNILSALTYLGLDYSDFKDLRHGGRGYRKMLQHMEYDINVYFSGDENMGTHFEVKGSAVYFFIDLVMRGKFGVENPFDGKKVIDWDLDSVSEIFKLILARGWFNRLDIAIDDIDACFFTCPKLYELLEKRCYVAKFKRYDHFVSYDTSRNCTGYTIYLGSKENSDLFIRVYDKYLEQLKAGADLTCTDWVRWEIVIKNEKADAFAGYIVRGLEIGYCTRTVLNGYMRLIKLDDVNRSRCSTLPKWERFVNTVDRTHLSIPRLLRTVDRARNWIDHQVMPTLSGLVCAYGGDMSFIYDNLEVNFDRLTRHDQQMFIKYSERSGDK